MKLLNLEILHLPGIDQGFSVDFHPSAVNVVTGPNGSGKSSLVRAVRALLYPDEKDGYCHVRARWLRDGDDGELVVERQDQIISWRVDDHSVPPPRLPGPENVGAFLISSEDLAAPGRTESHIGTQIKTLLAGGYDLEGLLSAPPLATPPRPRKLADELAAVDQKISAREAEHTRLHEELQHIDHLRQQLTAAIEAESRLRAINDALALAGARADLRATEHTLAAEFSDDMARLTGDEGDRVAEFDRQIGELTEELARQRRALEEAQDALAAASYGDVQSLEVLQAEIGEQREQHRLVESRIDQLEQALAGHRNDVEQYRQRLGATDPVPAAELDQAAIERMEQLVERAQGLREKIRSLAAELERCRNLRQAPAESRDSLIEARSCLRRWLELSSDSGLEGLLWGTLTGAASIAGWRVLTGTEDGMQAELLFLVLIAVGVPASLLGRFLMRYRAMREAEQGFLDTGLALPLGWTVSEVETRLERLESEIEAATQAEISQARAADLRELLNAHRQHLDSVRQRLEAHADSLDLGVKPRLEGSFLTWCLNLRDWQQAARQMEQARRQLEQAQGELKHISEHTCQVLEKHGQPAPEPLSARQLSALLHRLDPKLRRASGLHDRIGAQQRRIEELTGDINRLRRQRSELCERIGIDPDQVEILHRRLEQLAHWRELDQHRRQLRTEVERLRQRLIGEQELLDLASSGQLDTLERAGNEWQEQAGRRDELNRRIVELETRHAQILEQRELQALNLEREQARLALEEELDSHLLSRAAGTLVSEVMASHRNDNEPVALRRADEWFGRFTSHRYRLRLEGTRFSAVDTRLDHSRPLQELSTGTRMQLLLATRLAWIEQAEQGCESLPVFMDEVLTTSDPDRYHAVVRAVQELAVDHRQAIYLTAQPDDARAWTEWAGDGPGPHVIDMARVRAGQVAPLQLELPRADSTRGEIPDPDAMAPEQWAAEVGAGPIDPWSDAGAIHVFHLLRDDLTLAARLLRLDLNDLGAVEGFLTSDSAERLLDASRIDRLALRIQATRLALAHWRGGRYCPLSAAALADSGLITDTFMERVQKLRETVSGHPGMLIKGLREGKVRRFRSDVMDQLEQWLSEAGYLPDEPPTDHSPTAEICAQTGLEPAQTAALWDWLSSAISDPFGKSAQSD